MKVYNKFIKKANKSQKQFIICSFYNKNKNYLTNKFVNDIISADKQKKENKMLAMINIKLTQAIDVNEKYDNLLIVESIRDYIIKICDNEPEYVKNILNYKEHAMPKIIYSRPFKNSVRIFSLGEEGRIALNSIFIKIMSNGYLRIKNKDYKISGTPKLEIDLPFLPTSNGEFNIYTTLTPLNVFNRHNQKVFQAILAKHFGDGNYIDNSKKESVVAFYKEIEIYTAEQMKSSIQYSLSQLMGRKPSDFEFVNNIKIEWEDINIIHAHYHSEEKALPMVVGKFKSDFTMPKFLGYKIGKGFGEMSYKGVEKGMMCL